MNVKNLIDRANCPRIYKCPIDGTYTSCNKCQSTIKDELVDAVRRLNKENIDLKYALKHKSTSEVS